MQKYNNRVLLSDFNEAFNRRLEMKCEKWQREGFYKVAPFQDI